MTEQALHKLRRLRQPRRVAPLAAAALTLRQRGCRFLLFDSFWLLLPTSEPLQHKPMQDHRPRRPELISPCLNALSPARIWQLHSAPAQQHCLPWPHAAPIATVPDPA
jgi:hypothetical protein